ncbi:MAG: peptidase M23 [Fluviicola sp. XM-24bin1]|nr:MAG: peptidase M23 [Fluviicola sp. XM-24bin1]
MAKQHFKYNPKTLSYEEVKVSFGRKVFRVVLWLAPNILVAVLLAFIFTRQVDSPKNQEMQEELARQEREIKRLNKDMDDFTEALKAVQGRDEEMYRKALHAKAFPEELRMMGTGGSDRYAYLSDLPNSELLKSTSKKLDALERMLYAQSMSFDELAKLVQQKEQMVLCIPSIQPVRNSELKRPIGGYGIRIDPIYRTRMMHSGLDFTADRGTEVYATGDGVVVKVESKRWGYGKSIIIDHGFGYKTLYAHLSKFEVKEGQKIKRGELIGLIGSTGKSTGPHLHYEVIKDGVKVNPIGYFHSDLTPEQYEQMLEMSENSHEAMD